MNTYARIGAALAFAVVLTVGAGSSVSAITWGQPDTEARYPNVGAMVVDFPGLGPVPACSGTLIHPRIFLTAGHCTTFLEDYGIETVWVNFDANALNQATFVEVEEVITHPDYWWGPYSNPHDVAVLILKEAIRDITPAVLPPVGFLDELRADGLLKRAQFTMVGFGASLAWPPPIISYEDQRQFAQSEYQTLLKTWLRLSQNPATGDAGTCYGDSGGPAFWTEPDGTEVLVGITSWGDTPCVATGFNYRVDIPETLDFVHARVNEIETASTAAVDPGQLLYLPTITGGR